MDKTLVLLLIILAGLIYIKHEDLLEVLASPDIEINSGSHEEPKNSITLKDTIQTHNKENLDLTWHAYIPDTLSQTKLPVMVMVGGQNSSGQAFMKSTYKKFADENNFAIVSFDFKNHSGKDFEARRSYQFPNAWSADALNRVLTKLKIQYPINPFELYLFGFSAGAQFVHRYSLMYPTRAKSCASHAAGSYSDALGFQSTKFLVTVGEKDKKRTGKAHIFVDSLRRNNIDVQFEIIPKVGHSISKKQVQMSLDFFKQNRAKKSI